MGYYIKTNRKVAEFIGYKRTTLPDGNYTYWQEDMRRFLKGTNLLTLANLQKIAVEIGALVMTSEQMREEQNGNSCAELPTATNVRFVMEDTQEEASGNEGEGLNNVEHEAEDEQN